jgi:hypothetical protein
MSRNVVGLRGCAIDKDPSVAAHDSTLQLYSSRQSGSQSRYSGGSVRDPGSRAALVAYVSGFASRLSERNLSKLAICTDMKHHGRGMLKCAGVLGTIWKALECM